MSWVFLLIPRASASVGTPVFLFHPRLSHWPTVSSPAEIQTQSPATSPPPLQPPLCALWPGNPHTRPPTDGSRDSSQSDTFRMQRDHVTSPSKPFPWLSVSLDEVQILSAVPSPAALSLPPPPTPVPARDPSPAHTPAAPSGSWRASRLPVSSVSVEVSLCRGASVKQQPLHSPPWTSSTPSPIAASAQCRAQCTGPGCSRSPGWVAGC